ncbi:MAG: ABC transporter permease [Gemmatimonadota bacterium]
MRRALLFVAVALFIALVGLALARPWIAPADVPAIDIVSTRFLPPLTIDGYGVVHIFGTDRLGRDVWGRLLDGARVSLVVGALATIVAVTIGTLVGAVAGIATGPVSAALLALTDFVLALPRVVLLLLLAALWQPSATLVIVVLGLTGWMPIARLVYTETIAQLGRPYTEAARALGGRRRWILRRHVIPHALTPVVAASALGFGNAVTLEAGLSFLGLGVQPPAASWGTLIASGRDTVVNAPWVGVVPGVALALVVTLSVLLGDALTDRKVA